MSINIVQTETVAYLQAGTIQNTFHPHSAASFPDDVCDQHIIKASGNGGSGKKHDHPAANPVTHTTSVITTQPTASLPVSDPWQPVFQSSGHGGLSQRDPANNLMQQINLTIPWTSNKPLDKATHSKCQDNAIECTFKDIVINNFLGMLPSVPNQSAKPSTPTLHLN